MKLEGMSGPALLDVFNKLVVLDTKRKVKSFKSRETARRRIVHLLLKMDKDESDIEQLLEKLSSPSGKKDAKKRGYPDHMKIVILKSDQVGRGLAKERFLKLLKIEDKTVGSFVKVVGKVGQGDLKYWSEKGRIKIE